jgi:predicted phage terminase large subunit-like protein
MEIDPEVFDVVCRRSFGAFAYAAFDVVNPGQELIANWHIECICDQLERMAINPGTNRLVLNLPPRTLKSYLVSVCLPAWLLGRDPTSRIICASYAEDLSNKFSRDCRALMESTFYKRLFPNTRLNPKKITEGEFETTRRGFRLATSIGGVLTGRGGDILIIDDPTKANDAGSQVALASADEWFRNTAMSRLDNPAKSLVLVAQQRLHVSDLSGILIDKKWPSLVIPAIATESVDYPVGDDEVYNRPTGQVLQPDRDCAEAFEAIKREVGSHIFAAQYQQNPTPPEGNMIKAAWLGRFQRALDRKNYSRVVLSCDPAGKAGARNDYTAITVIGVHEKSVHLLHALRGHWTILQMRERILSCAAQFETDLVIIEDTSSGTGLIQLLKEQSKLSVIGRHPKDNKETRMSRHQGRFEAGRVMLPVEAPWLAEFENELLAFPHARYDDQVDALLLFLDWFAENEGLINFVVVGPVDITRAEMGLTSLIMDWSCHH